MHFEAMKGVLLSDTLVPDLFLSDCLPGLPGDAVKLYLYCVFLAKYGKNAEPEELAARLELETDTVQAAFVRLEQDGLLIRTRTGFSLTDLKEREINRLYRKRTDSLPEDAIANSAANIRRNQSIEGINRMFFQGLMSPSWYTAVDHWFDDFKFDEDVMFALVKYCHDMGKLGLNYVRRVAEGWHRDGVRTHWDLERHMEERDQIMAAKKRIARLLGRSYNLTEPEERYVRQWLLEWKFGLDIVELAVEKTTSRPNANFDYLNGILKRWHEAGYTTIEEIRQHDVKPRRAKSDTAHASGAEVPRRNNFEQRNYDDDFFDKLSGAALKTGTGKGGSPS